MGICNAYRVDGQLTPVAPLGAENYDACEAVIEELPGWTESTAGIREYAKLPENAKAYIRRIEALVGVNVVILSTGPERDETIILEHPFH